MTGQEIVKDVVKDVDDVVVADKPQTLKTTLDIDYALYQEFSEYLLLKYGNNNIITENRQNEINSVFQKGLFVSKQELSSVDTIILFKEKKPRKDVLEKLGRIAFEFMQLDNYPCIKPSNLTQCINKVIGLCDQRTKDDYKACILQYVNKKSAFDCIDVSSFVQLIPKQFLREKLD